MTIWTEPRLQPENMRLSEFPASRGESIAAGAGDTFAEAPTFQAGNLAELQIAMGEREDIGAMIERVQAGEDPGQVAFGPQPERPKTPIAEARERVKKEGLDGTLKLPEREDIPTQALDIMVDRARARRQREQVIARGPQDWTQTVLNSGTSFLVGAIDPLNVASAFIPVVGEMRYAKMLADAGFSQGRRAGAAAITGAAGGAVGVAALQPLDALSRTQEGQDWQFAHSLQNVMFGAGLGALLMGAGRYVGDVRRARADRPMYPFDVGEILDDHPAWADLRKPPEFKPLVGQPDLPTLPERFPDAEPVPTREAATIMDLPPRAQEDAMRVAVASLVNGEPVRAGEMLEAAAAVDPRIAESFDVWHGSPHQFDAFQMSQIGTGEGAQAYGHGLYFAEREAVARSYQLLGDATINGRPFDINNPVHKAVSLVDEFGSREAAIREAEARAKHDLGDFYGDVLSTLKSDKELPRLETTGNLYRTRIRANRDHFLDWDKPLSEQSEHVKAALRKLGFSEKDDHKIGALIYESQKLVPGEFANKAEAARVLREAGIPGIRYLDQGSRDGGDGTRNFVIFDDKLTQIVERNGQPVQRPAPDPAITANAWRDLSRDAPEHSAPDVVATAEAVAKMEPPKSTVDVPAAEPAPIRREAPIVKFRRDAQAIEATLAPVAEGQTRLWRGNRRGEVGKATRFTNDLPGIALPFREGYGGDVSYVDVSTADLPKYEQTGTVAPGAEFTVPHEIAARAEIAFSADEKVIHVGPKAARGPRARPPETWSLLEFIASRGGLSPDDPLVGDIRSLIGTNNKFIPGFGHLIRKGGMPLDRAREAAVEAGYLFDAGDLTGRQAKTNVSTLLDAMDSEARGQKVYRQGVDISELPAERKRVAEANRDALERRIDESLAEVEIDTASMPDKTRARVLQIMEREGETDPVAAWERAVMEDYQDGAEAGQHKRIPAEITGWDVPNDASPASRAGGTAARGRERGTGDAGGPAGEGNRAPGSESARAAIEAERQIAELYDAEVAAGYIDADGRAALEATLNKIDQENAARTAVVREGAACLLAGFGAAAL